MLNLSCYLHQMRDNDSASKEMTEALDPNTQYAWRLPADKSVTSRRAASRCADRSVTPATRASPARGQIGHPCPPRRVRRTAPGDRSASAEAPATDVRFERDNVTPATGFRCKNGGGWHGLLAEHREAPSVARGSP